MGACPALTDLSVRITVLPQNGPHVQRQSYQHEASQYQRDLIVLFSPKRGRQIVHQSVWDMWPHVPRIQYHSTPSSTRSIPIRMMVCTGLQVLLGMGIGRSGRAGRSLISRMIIPLRGKRSVMKKKNREEEKTYRLRPCTWELDYWWLSQVEIRSISAAHHARNQVSNQVGPGLGIMFSRPVSTAKWRSLKEGNVRGVRHHAASTWGSRCVVSMVEDGYFRA